MEPTRGTRPLTECAEHFAGGRCFSSAVTSFFPALEGIADGLHLLLGDPQLATLNVIDDVANPLELRSLHRHGIFAFDQEEARQAHPRKVFSWFFAPTVRGAGHGIRIFSRRVALFLSRGGTEAGASADCGFLLT